MPRAFPGAIAVAALVASAFVPATPARRDAPAALPAPAAPWPPVGGREPPETADDVVAGYNLLAPEVPRDVMAERVALNLPRNALLERIGEEPSFAGSWYDYGAGLWNLLGTDQARLDVWAEWARAKGIEPAPRLVRYSNAELWARVERLQGGTDPLSRYARFGIEVDVQNNRLTVVVPEHPGVRDDMIVWVGFDDVPFP